MYNLPHAQNHAVVLPYVVALDAPSVPASEQRMALAFGAASALDGLQRLREQVSAPAPCGITGCARTTSRLLPTPSWRPRPRQPGAGHHRES